MQPEGGMSAWERDVKGRTDCSRDMVSPGSETRLGLGDQWAEASSEVLLNGRPSAGRKGLERPCCEHTGPHPNKGVKPTGQSKGAMGQEVQLLGE